MSAILQGWAAELTWHPVQSSNISAVAWKDSVGMLFVKFKSGKTYSYERVPEQVFRNLLWAPSVGKYFDRNIKNAGYAYHGPF